MSYCIKSRRNVSIQECLACDECRAPIDRLDGRMCENEFFNVDELSLEEYAYRKFPELRMRNIGHDMNEDLRNSFIDGGNLVLSKLPIWKKGTPPYKGWWLTRTAHADGTFSIALESFVDDRWPHEDNNNILYLDMNVLKVLPIEKD